MPAPSDKSLEVLCNIRIDSKNCWKCLQINTCDLMTYTHAILLKILTPTLKL